MSLSRPILVASYCAYFLKAEMRHVYRQIVGLEKTRTFVITQQRQNAEKYPFEDIELVVKPQPRTLNEQLVQQVGKAYHKYVERRPPLVYRGEFEAIRKILIRRDPDLMHIYFGNTGVHLLPLIQRWDRPCVVSFHGMDVQPRIDEKGYSTKLRALFHHVALVLVRSESIAERVQALGCDPAKIRMNRTSVPLNGFETMERLFPVDGAWRVVQACRLIPKKGLFTSLKAFKAFSEIYPKSTFEIAGDGPLKPELEREIAALGLSERVRFKGFLDQTALCEFYSQAHLFIHPSEITQDANQEGVPNSMLEAMATGLPVVATRHGGIPEAVEDSVSGFLVNERDDQALVQRMLQIAGDEALWQSMGAAASRAVKEKFDSVKGIAMLEESYLEARKGRR